MKVKVIEAGMPQMERPKMYEFYEAQTVKDMEDRDVQIPRSVGRATLEQLEAQKVDVEAKIAAIKAKEE